MLATKGSRQTQALFPGHNKPQPGVGPPGRLCTGFAKLALRLPKDVQPQGFMTFFKFANSRFFFANLAELQSRSQVWPVDVDKSLQAVRVFTPRYHSRTHQSQIITSRCPWGGLSSPGRRPATSSLPAGATSLTGFTNQCLRPSAVVASGNATFPSPTPGPPRECRSPFGRGTTRRECPGLAGHARR